MLRVPFASHSHDSLSSALWNVFVWVLAISCQAAYIAIVVVIIALPVFIFLPIWFGTGVILLWTKADAMRGVWDVWYFVWTTSREFDSDENVVVDTHILNSSLFAHYIMESIPNMKIQIVNNIQLQAPWTAIAIASIMFSLYNVLAGLYRYVYYRHMTCCYVKRQNLEDIPISQSINIP